MTSRKLVFDTLNYNNPARVPRQLWILPWAQIYHQKELKKITNIFPDDIDTIEGCYKIAPSTIGDPYEVGEYIDYWGCKFVNKQKGVIGEVKESLIIKEEWEDRYKLRIPEELITLNKEKINQKCRKSNKFTMSGYTPRPFKQLQFIRGTEKLYIDLMLKPQGLYDVIERIFIVSNHLA